jgi:hypothetical protein
VNTIQQVGNMARVNLEYLNKPALASTSETGLVIDQTLQLTESYHSMHDVLDVLGPENDAAAVRNLFEKMDQRMAKANFETLAAALQGRALTSDQFQETRSWRRSLQNFHQSVMGLCLPAPVQYVCTHCQPVVAG